MLASLVRISLADNAIAWILRVVAPIRRTTARERDMSDWGTSFQTEIRFSGPTTDDQGVVQQIGIPSPSTVVIWSLPGSKPGQSYAPGLLFDRRGIPKRQCVATVIASELGQLGVWFGRVAAHEQVEMEPDMLASMQLLDVRERLGRPASIKSAVVMWPILRPIQVKNLH